MSTTVLLVEDNEMNRDMLSRRLERKGYDVVCAMDGEEALQQALATRPSLILMDLSIPKIDGWECSRRLKADPLTRNIPIIALTAHALRTDRAKALASGCDDYETKPITFSSLLNKIEKLLPGSPVDNGSEE